MDVLVEAKMERREEGEHVPGSAGWHSLGGTAAC